MTTKLFGTDGIRGEANSEPMTAATALRVAQGAALEFRRGEHRHVAVIGKDTRLSGYMLENAMTAGFLSMGLDVILVGPLPTPAVALLTKSLRADIGVQISASHNPFQDNGIKLFGHDGFKLSDEVETAIADHVRSDRSLPLAEPLHIGQAKRMEDAKGRYIEYAKNTFPRDLRLDGLKIVLDCANGAAYNVAPRVLWELGAEVLTLGVSPNGTNINDDCGATAPEAMCREVRRQRADLGIALDGDADRVIISDESGEILDGDQIMGLVATAWHDAGRLTGGGLVATVMSNLGLERHLRGLGLDLIRTKVGDRFVVERMRDGAFNLGGEQSGHIIFGDYSTTGDGLVSALQVLAQMVDKNLPASRIGQVFQPVPQILENVRYDPAMGSPLTHPGVAAAIKQAEARIASQGRLLIRASGTEPLIRVMGEGDDRALVQETVSSIARAVTQAGQESAAPGAAGGAE